MSAISKINKSVSPSTLHETLFILVPMSSQINETDIESYSKKVFDQIVEIIDDKIGKHKFRNSIIFQKSYMPSDFAKNFDYFGGNSFAHTNTFDFKNPSMNSKCKNAVFVGGYNLTNPGPGMPLSLLSGIFGANVLHKLLESDHSEKVKSYNLISDIYNLLKWGFVVSHLLIVIGFILSQRIRSMIYCIRLMHIHGRTYFAASTLMRWTQFLDTAALYALFRVTDDLVDTVEDTAKRSKSYENFKRQFWKCYESGVGDYNMHPIFPIVIETVQRLDLKAPLFHSFFNSMEMDLKDELVCKNLSETVNYMDGSAAIIGEMMLPILIPNGDKKTVLSLTESARALGYAFQLTNFLRDIGEDVTLGRQYIPQNVCDKYGVDLKKFDHNQLGFKSLMEEMFAVADQYYKSADEGIIHLPNEVGKLIRVARYVYHELHQVIRNNNYQIFESKLKVPFYNKILITWSHISFISVLRIILVEFYFYFFFEIFPFVVYFLITSFMISTIKIYNCSYGLFLGIFIIVPLLLFWGFALFSLNRRHVVNTLYCSVLLSFLAVIYTSLWDNYLVYAGIWSYGNNRIIGTLGLVPFEEYSFFVLETLLVSGVWLFFFPDEAKLISPPLIKPKSSISTKPKAASLKFFIFCELLAFILFFFQKQSLYCGLIIGWVIPILALQWVYGSHALIEHRRVIVRCILYLFSYLSLSDQWAIRNGIWSISSNYSLFNLLPHLPFEESLFFLLTTTMCVWGLTLFMLGLTHNSRKPSQRLMESVYEVVYWESKA